MFRFVLTMALAAAALPAQVTLQESHTTASLRGIHSLGGGVAWVSGTGGTVLRTLDGGSHWQPCAVPEGAERLDFRAVQAFDERTALVMSAGKGDASRLYRTTNGCRTWKLVLANPDKDGFWDALRFSGPGLGVLVGDPVDGSFPVFLSEDGGNIWRRPEPKGIRAEPNQSLFAASNSSVLIDRGRVVLLTGGGTTALISADLHFATPAVYSHPELARGESAGGFSVASEGEVFVAVGGDYKAAAQTIGTAVWCKADRQGAFTCQAAQTPPRGYRSAVAYDEPAKMWIAAGPTGVDISTDGGANWRAADGGADWNAISLPFLVGSNGRIGLIASAK
jgi:photosystem II stability/assembly factor-like uncharacterized protein